MILHVVGGEGEFQPERAQAVEHEDFFIGRIRDTDAASVYSFKPESATKARLEGVARGEEQFQPAAQALAREFSRVHVGTSIEGAFFIFELQTDVPHVRLYSFIKYDYHEAIERSQGDHGSLLRRIVHAFITDRRAIQKSAIIRVVNGVAELAISARDRARIAPDISDYYATFLDAIRSRTNQELNQRTVDVLRETLTACQDHLPNRDVARALRHAKGLLRDRQQVTEAAITEAVLAAADNPDDENVRSELERQTTRRIRNARLAGLAFRPDRGILRKPPMRQLKTTEGVTVIFPDEADGTTVRRMPQPGGGETITIYTDEITEDRVVRDGPRRIT